MKRSLMSTINLGNSIIGVSILAMPYCFKHCGVVLSTVLVCISAVLNYYSCRLLLHAARLNRRRNFELLAYDAFGPRGKTMVELAILLSLMGTCVAFFVIVADIGPTILSLMFGLEASLQLRILTLVFLAAAGVLPCGLLRNVENLTSFSFISLLVYSFLAARMFFLALERFVSSADVNLWVDINYWNSSFVITTLPIFSMAFACQPQLFEVFHYDLQQHRSFKSIMRSIKQAIYITSLVYIGIGFFGYIAFYDQDYGGNILQILPSGFISQLTLLAFLISLLTSFPLLLFPCRTSLHSLLFRKGGYNDFLSTAHSIHMSDLHFNVLTVVIIGTTLGIAIIFSHVEFVLALSGSTIGATICFIFPALIFMKITDRSSVLSYLLLLIGSIILVFCTFSVVFESSADGGESFEKIPTKIIIHSSSTTTTMKSILKINKTLEDYKARMNSLHKLKESLKRKQEAFKITLSTISAKHNDTMMANGTRIEQPKLMPFNKTVPLNIPNNSSHREFYHVDGNKNNNEKIIVKPITERHEQDHSKKIETRHVENVIDTRPKPQDGKPLSSSNARREEPSAIITNNNKSNNIPPSSKPGGVARAGNETKSTHGTRRKSEQTSSSSSTTSTTTTTPKAAAIKKDESL